MRRFTFYTFVALLTFGVGSLITFNLFWKTQPASPKPEQKPQLEISDQTRSSETFSVDATNPPVYESASKDVEGKKPFCKDMFEIKYFDLNNDGKKEILVRGKNFNTCQYNGNCSFIIFKLNGKKYEDILSSTDYFEATGDIGDQIKQSKTLKYRDIEISEHISSSDTAHTTYEFDGKEYIESKCVVNAYQSQENGEGVWKNVSCKKYLSEL
ncbi:hypothetical protein BH20ACI4_BH20ACI4_18510 [soil metagenome]